MLRFKVSVLITLLQCIIAGEAAKILAIFPHLGKSHYFMFQPYVYELAKRGHEIHVITHFPDNNPPKNVKFVSLKEERFEAHFNSMPLDTIDIVKYVGQTVVSLYGLYDMSQETCEGLGHPNVQKLISDKPKFDIAIVEFFNTDCFASLSHIFNVPLVGIFSSVMMPWHNDRFGNPDNPAYIPNHFLDHMPRMSFLERAKNTLTTYASKLIYRLVYDRYADNTIQKYLGDGIPPVREIVKKATLFLVNTHFSLFQPRPLVPGIIELGGFHVTNSTGKIPPNVLKYIEDSPNGVIFFSLGSTVRGATMPKYKVEIFQKVFAKLKMPVIWKWEEDTMEGKPDNVLIGKWFPQNDILAHPKVKLFITHCGLMGMEEAVYHGVPMLLMPLYGDQPVNAASAADKKVGVMLDYFHLTEETLTDALQKVLEDKSYSDNAKQLAKIFMDRPLSILDTAIYWTEYVIRYKGASHLRSAVVELAWYQEYLLDVIAFYIFILIAIAYLFKKVCGALFRTMCKKKQKQKRKDKKQ